MAANALQVSPQSRSAATAAATVGTSPYQIQNTGGNALLLILSGGTVTDISYGRDGTNWFSTGQTAGQFYLAPGDYLQVTHTGAPSVKQVFSL